MNSTSIFFPIGLLNMMDKKPPAATSAFFSCLESFRSSNLGVRKIFPPDLILGDHKKDPSLQLREKMPLVLSTRGFPKIPVWVGIKHCKHIVILSDLPAKIVHEF